MSEQLAISEKQDNPGCNDSYQSRYKADAELVLVVMRIRDFSEVSSRSSVRSWGQEVVRANVCTAVFPTRQEPLDTGYAVRTPPAAYRKLTAMKMGGYNILSAVWDLHLVCGCPSLPSLQAALSMVPQCA